MGRCLARYVWRGVNITTLQHNIRKATAGDVEAIAALTDEAYAKFIPRIGRKPQPMTADYARMVAENTIWLMTHLDQIIGVLVLINEPEHMLIYSVAIKPTFQKLGLGRQLLTWAEMQAIQQGYKSIRLYTNTRFEENIRLYQQFGYTETGRAPLENSHIVYMAKQLWIGLYNQLD